MKRRFLSVLSILMALTLAGCGKKPADGDPNGPGGPSGPSDPGDPGTTELAVKTALRDIKGIDTVVLDGTVDVESETYGCKIQVVDNSSSLEMYDISTSNVLLGKYCFLTPATGSITGIQFNYYQGKLSSTFDSDYTQIKLAEAMSLMTNTTNLIDAVINADDSAFTVSGNTYTLTNFEAPINKSLLLAQYHMSSGTFAADNVTFSQISFVLVDDEIASISFGYRDLQLSAGQFVFSSYEYNIVIAPTSDVPNIVVPEQTTTLSIGLDLLGDMKVAFEGATNVKLGFYKHSNETISAPDAYSVGFEPGVDSEAFHYMFSIASPVSDPYDKMTLMYELGGEEKCSVFIPLDYDPASVGAGASFALVVEDLSSDSFNTSTGLLEAVHVLKHFSNQEPFAVHFNFDASTIVGWDGVKPHSFRFIVSSTDGYVGEISSTFTQVTETYANVVFDGYIENNHPNLTAVMMFRQGSDVKETMPFELEYVENHSHNIVVEDYTNWVEDPASSGVYKLAGVSIQVVWQVYTYWFDVDFSVISTWDNVNLASFSLYVILDDDNPIRPWGECLGNMEVMDTLATVSIPVPENRSIKTVIFYFQQNGVDKQSEDLEFTYHDKEYGNEFIIELPDFSSWEGNTFKGASIAVGNI